MGFTAPIAKIGAIRGSIIIARCEIATLDNTTVTWTIAEFLAGIRAIRLNGMTIS